jgi:hypothetical protein
LDLFSPVDLKKSEVVDFHHFAESIAERSGFQFPPIPGGCRVNLDESANSMTCRGSI